MVVVDGMEGHRASSPELLQEHTGHPHPGRRLQKPARHSEDIGLFGTVQLIIAGGLSATAPTALRPPALGADVPATWAPLR